MQRKKSSAHMSRRQKMFSFVQKYLASGVTQKQFCRQKSIALSTFQWWLYEYRRNAKTSLPTKPSPNKFIKLPLSGSSVLSQHSYSIKYPNGITIRFSGPVDVQ